MSSAMLEPMDDFISGLKYLMIGANPGPFEPTGTYGAIVSDTEVPGDYPPEPQHYNSKTLICETVQSINGPLMVALMNNAAGMIDALENLMEALESAGVSPETVDAIARAQRMNGMKRKVEKARRDFGG